MSENPLSQKQTPVQSDTAEEYPLLSQINSPADLRRLPVDRLPEVCAELRRFLIAHLSNNPGHFASSMGAIEIIVATHYVFDTPTDHLVFDVGHQAYAHKILTGRRDDFASQRTMGGISGFPTPSESQYDTFTAGHAGNSISAALGMAIADKLTPEHQDRKTVALVGDASISCGLAFEGLNNASNSPNDLLIILNDNDMSIDNNVGALHRYLSDLTTSEGYNRIRYALYKRLRRKGVIGDKGKGLITRFNNSVKALVSQQQNIFEGLNIRYFGPFDGHDVVKIVKVLQEIKDMNGPRLLHLHTVKGKGYAEAEKDPQTWHAPGKFNPVTGERPKGNGSPKPPKWQDVFGEALVELAKENPDIVGITAAMPSGTSIALMQKEFPDRTFDTGISEGHAVTFAGGLATAGKHPFVAIYSSFLQRAYDNIINDVCIQHLPVTFCIDRAGLVGEDGVTHHGLFDLAYLNCIPGMYIASPADEQSLRNLMYTASKHQGPMAIRYPRGNTSTLSAPLHMEQMQIGKGRILEENKEARMALLSIGPMADTMKEAAITLNEEGITTSRYDMIWLNPLDTEMLDEIAGKYEGIVTLEDGAIKGGFGETVKKYLMDKNHDISVKVLGVPDRWIGHGTLAQLHRLTDTDAQAVVAAVKDIINSRSK